MARIYNPPTLEAGKRYTEILEFVTGSPDRALILPIIPKLTSQGKFLDLNAQPFGTFGKFFSYLNSQFKSVALELGSSAGVDVQIFKVEGKSKFKGKSLSIITYPMGLSTDKSFNPSITTQNAMGVSVLLKSNGIDQAILPYTFFGIGKDDRDVLIRSLNGLPESVLLYGGLQTTPKTKTTKKKTATKKAQKKTTTKTKQPTFTEAQLSQIEDLVEILTDFKYPNKNKGFTKSDIEKLGEGFKIFIPPKLTKSKQIKFLVEAVVKNGVARPLEVLRGFDRPALDQDEESYEDVSEDVSEDASEDVSEESSSDYGEGPDDLDDVPNFATLMESVPAKSDRVIEPIDDGDFIDYAQLVKPPNRRIKSSVESFQYDVVRPDIKNPLQRIPGSPKRTVVLLCWNYSDIFAGIQTYANSLEDMEVRSFFLQFMREWANNQDYTDSYFELRSFNPNFVQIIEQPTTANTLYPKFGSYLFEQVDVSPPDNDDEMDDEIEDESEEYIDVRFHQFGSGLIIKDKYSGSEKVDKGLEIVVLYMADVISTIPEQVLEGEGEIEMNIFLATRDEIEDADLHIEKNIEALSDTIGETCLDRNGCKKRPFYFISNNFQPKKKSFLNTIMGEDLMDDSFYIPSIFSDYGCTDVELISPDAINPANTISDLPLIKEKKVFRKGIQGTSNIDSSLFFWDTSWDRKKSDGDRPNDIAQDVLQGIEFAATEMGSDLINIVKLNYAFVGGYETTSLPQYSFYTSEGKVDFSLVEMITQPNYFRQYYDEKTEQNLQSKRLLNMLNGLSTADFGSKIDIEYKVITQIPEIRKLRNGKEVVTGYQIKTRKHDSGYDTKDFFGKTLSQDKTFFTLPTEKRFTPNIPYKTSFSTLFSNFKSDNLDFLTNAFLTPKRIREENERSLQRSMPLQLKKRFESPETYFKRSFNVVPIVTYRKKTFQVRTEKGTEKVEFASQQLYESIEEELKSFLFDQQGGQYLASSAFVFDWNMFSSIPTKLIKNHAYFTTDYKGNPVVYRGPDCLIHLIRRYLAKNFFPVVIFNLPDRMFGKVEQQTLASIDELKIERDQFITEYTSTPIQHINNNSIAMLIGIIGSGRNSFRFTVGDMPEYMYQYDQLSFFRSPIAPFFSDDGKLLPFRLNQVVDGLNPNDIFEGIPVGMKIFNILQKQVLNNIEILKHLKFGYTEKDGEITSPFKATLQEWDEFKALDRMYKRQKEGKGTKYLQKNNRGATLLKVAPRVYAEVLSLFANGLKNEGLVIPEVLPVYNSYIKKNINAINENLKKRGFEHTADLKEVAKLTQIAKGEEEELGLNRNQKHQMKAIRDYNRKRDRQLRIKAKQKTLSMTFNENIAKNMLSFIDKKFREITSRKHMIELINADQMQNSIAREFISFDLVKIKDLERVFDRIKNDIKKNRGYDKKYKQMFAVIKEQLDQLYSQNSELLNKVNNNEDIYQEALLDQLSRDQVQLEQPTPPPGSMPVLHLYAIQQDGKFYKIQKSKSGLKEKDPYPFFIPNDLFSPLNLMIGALVDRPSAKTQAVDIAINFFGGYSRQGQTLREGGTNEDAYALLAARATKKGKSGLAKTLKEGSAYEKISAAIQNFGVGGFSFLKKDQQKEFFRNTPSIQRYIDKKIIPILKENNQIVTTTMISKRGKEYQAPVMKNGSMILIDKGREVLVSEYERNQYRNAERLSQYIEKNLLEQQRGITDNFERCIVGPAVKGIKKSSEARDELYELSPMDRINQVKKSSYTYQKRKEYSDRQDQRTADFKAEQEVTRIAEEEIRKNALKYSCVLADKGCEFIFNFTSPKNRGTGNIFWDFRLYMSFLNFLLMEYPVSVNRPFTLDNRKLNDIGYYTPDYDAYLIALTKSKRGQKSGLNVNERLLIPLIDNIFPFTKSISLGANSWQNHLVPKLLETLFDIHSGDQKFQVETVWKNLDRMTSSIRPKDPQDKNRQVTFSSMIEELSRVAPNRSQITLIDYINQGSVPMSSPVKGDLEYTIAKYNEVLKIVLRPFVIVYKRKVCKEKK